MRLLAESDDLVLVGRLSPRLTLSTVCVCTSQQHYGQSSVADKSKARTRMECLTSSAMSPGCSSSGSESSVTAPAPTTYGSPDYLAQLLKDRKQMQAFSNVFIHLGRILEDGESFCTMA